MTIETAIKNAIKSGWNWKKDFNYPENLKVSPDEITALAKVLTEKVFMSPDFWRSLGRHEQWTDGCLLCNEENAKNCTCDYYDLEVEGYLYHWHKFIDSLASGYDPKEYFKQL